MVGVASGPATAIPVVTGIHAVDQLFDSDIVALPEGASAGDLVIIARIDMRNNIGGWNYESIRNNTFGDLAYRFLTSQDISNGQVTFCTGAVSETGAVVITINGADPLSPVAEMSVLADLAVEGTVPSYEVITAGTLALAVAVGTTDDNETVTSPANSLSKPIIAFAGIATSSLNGGAAAIAAVEMEDAGETGSFDFGGSGRLPYGRIIVIQPPGD
jgi:hypothetical protein